MLHFLLFLFLTTSCFAQKTAAPRIWNDRDLAEWAAPVVGLNVRPGHFSEQDYQAAAQGEWVRTYPVYFPGREPKGYWDQMRRKKPEPLIRAGARTPKDWIAAGRQVFRELDVSIFRSYDPKHFAILQSADELKKIGAFPRKDGTIGGFRLVPTKKGLALSVSECAGCHTRVMPDGSTQDGPPVNEEGNALLGEIITAGLLRFFDGDSVGMMNWRSFAVPWIPGDIHEGIRTMPEAEVNALLGSNIAGTFPRFNGSPYYTTKIPDLIGVGDRKYLDATATHQMRGPEDLGRYGALVNCCDSADFGPHRMLSDKQRVVIEAYPDELLYALGKYIVSIEPPPNPNLGDTRIGEGRKIFDREGCAGCHAPPLYTNNKLTLAAGYRAPKDHPFAADILPLSVGTDPNLALRTRKGTGLYKIPTLKGVWYRGLLGHDGSVRTLEEWFDPARLRDDYVPSGFKGYKVERRAVPGHEFGLKLNGGEKGALLAFLRSL